MRQNLDEIKKVLEDHSYPIDLIICKLLKKFKFNFICNAVGAVKEQGYSVTEIINLMILIPLMLLRSVNAYVCSEFSGVIQMQKDTIYRLKNSENMPWRRILLSVSKKFQKLVEDENEVKNLVTAFIVDDTTDSKTGQVIENISYVHDHASGKNCSKLGFKDLFLGYHDGKSMIPLDFSIHKEKELSKKKRKEQYKKEVSKNTEGFKRRAEATVDKITNSISMIKRAVKNGFLPKYTLVDAWFTSHKFINEIRAIKNGAIHVVGGMKRDKRLYEYQGGNLNAKALLTTLRAQGQEKRNKSWNIRYFEVVVNYEGIGLVKLYFCRFPYQKEWRLFISTDTSLSLTKMLEVYSIRWTIEVMFKELKQYLGFGKCQSRDFDAQIAHVTTSCILFILLTYSKRIEDYTTLEGILAMVQQEVAERTLAERIWSIFQDLLEAVINIISQNGCMDISEFKASKEYIFLKDLFESSLLVNQLKNVS
jgi:hypothetical protein